MKYIKMFIAGLAFPSFVIPFIILILSLSGKSQVLTIPFLHFIPIIWGVWNILYFTHFSKILPGDSDTKLLLTGGILGLLIALCAIFWLHVPALLGIPSSLTYLPLVIGPILYAIIWRFIVRPLNHLLGLFS